MPDRELVDGLAAKLKAARDAAGLSQQDAGEKSGVHHVSIARFETDKRVPTLAILYKLAAAYGVTVCDLLPPADGESLPGAGETAARAGGAGTTAKKRGKGK
ncbi:helix-turn-helix domain-containing protein [Gemmata sp.]|uniref:helix-turn-helix domain-containing protein n=1 Tax=Gemmata sp. TaxID=1914242 RepID=UPI003F714975